MVGERGDHRQVRDAYDLTLPGEPAEALPHRLGDGATDAGIYFVEDQEINAVARVERELERQHHARQLASGGDPLERAGWLAGIGREAQRHLVEAERPGQRLVERLHLELECRRGEPERLELAREPRTPLRRGRPAPAGQGARRGEASGPGALDPLARAGTRTLGVVAGRDLVLELAPPDEQI